MDLILLLVAVALVGVVAAVAVGRLRGGLEEPVRSRRDNALPAGRLEPSDLGRARFSVGLRGYRMDEVDAALDRVQAELAERDAEVTTLRGALRDQAPDQRVGPAPDPAADPAADPATDPATDPAGR